MCEVAGQLEDVLVLAACCGGTAAVGIFFFSVALCLAVSPLVAPFSPTKVDQLFVEGSLIR